MGLCGTLSFFEPGGRPGPRPDGLLPGRPTRPGDLDLGGRPGPRALTAGDRGEPDTGDVSGDLDVGDANLHGDFGGLLGDCPGDFGGRPGDL